jgi:hypothetical protein
LLQPFSEIFQNYFKIVLGGDSLTFWHEMSIIPRESQKATSMTLPAEGDSLNFLGGGEPARFHCFGRAFVSGSE